IIAVVTPNMSMPSAASSGPSHRQDGVITTSHTARAARRSPSQAAVRHHSGTGARHSHGLRRLADALAAIDPRLGRLHRTPLLPLDQERSERVTSRTGTKCLQRTYNVF